MSCVQEAAIYFITVSHYSLPIQEQKAGVVHVALGGGSSWGTKASGSKRSPSPSHVIFCFQITRINKLILSVLVLMGFSLLATSYNVLVTFIISRDILCGTLRQGHQAYTRSSIQLFIFFSVFSGFYVAGFFFFCLSLFFSYTFSVFPPTLSDFPFSV